MHVGTRAFPILTHVRSIVGRACSATIHTFMAQTSSGNKQPPTYNRLWCSSWQTRLIYVGLGSLAHERHIDLTTVRVRFLMDGQLWPGPGCKSHRRIQGGHGGARSKIERGSALAAAERWTQSCFRRGRGGARFKIEFAINPARAPETQYHARRGRRGRASAQA